jgi:hypothetical protein
MTFKPAGLTQVKFMFIGTNPPWGSAVACVCVDTYLLCETADVTTMYVPSDPPYTGSFWLVIH